MLFSPWPLPLPRLDLSLSLSALSALSDLSSFGPRLVPPEIVVVAPLFLTLSPPSLGARDELELLRDTVAELLFDELRDRLRRLEFERFELAEVGREGSEGGARVSTGGGEMSGEDMVGKSGMGRIERESGAEGEGRGLDVAGIWSWCLVRNRVDSLPTSGGVDALSERMGCRLTVGCEQGIWKRNNEG